MSPPDPLVPAEVDLRDFGYMPLDVRRLLTSETWIEAAEDPRLGHALVSLWFESWHQVPAASVPNNDTVLFRFSMCPSPDEWGRIRERALRGWSAQTGGFITPLLPKSSFAWQDKVCLDERNAALWLLRQAQKQGIAAQGNRITTAMRMPKQPQSNRRAIAEQSQSNRRTIAHAIGLPKGRGKGRGRGKGKGKKKKIRRLRRPSLSARLCLQNPPSRKKALHARPQSPSRLDPEARNHRCPDRAAYGWRNGEAVR